MSLFSGQIDDFGQFIVKILLSDQFLDELSNLL